MPPSSVGIGITQHPGQLRHPILAVDELDIAGGDPFPCGLGHDEVPLGTRRDLGEMGYHQDLPPGRNLREGLPNLGSDFAANALIDLIEDERRHRIVPGQNDFEREHQSGQLAAGGGLGKRPGLDTRIEPDRIADGLLTNRIDPPQSGQFDLEPPSGEAELGKQPGHGTGQPAGSLATLDGKGVGRCLTSPFGGHPSRRELPEIEVRGIEQVQFPRRRYPRLGHRL